MCVLVCSFSVYKRVCVCDDSLAFDKKSDRDAVNEQSSHEHCVTETWEFMCIRVCSNCECVVNCTTPANRMYIKALSPFNDSFSVVLFRQYFWVIENDWISIEDINIWTLNEINVMQIFELRSIFQKQRIRWHKTIDLILFHSYRFMICLYVYNNRKNRLASMLLIPKNRTAVFKWLIVLVVSNQFCLCICCWYVCAVRASRIVKFTEFIIYIFLWIFFFGSIVVSQRICRR